MHFVYGYLVVNVPVQKEKKRKEKRYVRCKKSVKCVFFAVPNGNSCFLYNIFLRGKFAIPVKKKKMDRNK